MKKFLRTFDTEEEYLAYTASTEYYLNSVARCRQGSLVFYNPEDCGSQGIHRTISGETYCDGYDKRVYIYKQVSYDDGVTWETTATTSALVEKDSEDCGYVPPTQYDIVNKVRSTNSYSPTRVVSNYCPISSITEIEIDGVVQQNVSTGYTLSEGEHTVKYKLAGTTLESNTFRECSAITSCDIVKNVTDIGYNEFSNCSGLTSCTIGDSVTSIDYALFFQCTALKSVKIGSGVTSIGDSAFEYCNSLTSITVDNNNATFDSRNNCNAIINTSSNELVFGCNTTTIPNTVTSIGKCALRAMRVITSVNIPDSVTAIGSEAFWYCSGLTSVTIGTGITSIGYDAFDYCRSLTSVTVNAVIPPTLQRNDVFDNTNNCPIYVPCDSVDVYKAAANWSTYASRIQAIAGSCPIVLTAKFNITDTDNPTRIASGTSGFNKIEIDGVVQPNVTTGYTFSTTGEHIVKYTLMSTNIGWCAFGYCSGLTSIDIPDSVTSIDIQAFAYCSSLTGVTIPDSVTKIPRYSFVGCGSITSITIPNSVTSIEYGAFMSCSGITSIVVPDSVTSIGNAVFSSCKSLTSAIIPNTMTSIGESFFNGCINLTKLNSNVDGVFNIPSSVTSIGNYAFYNCSGLTSCTIGDSVTSIGEYAFAHCSGLISCTIGDSVTSIGEYAFAYCSGLISIISNVATAPTIDYCTFNNVGSNGTLYVPQGSTGYNVWMGTGYYYLGMYNWTKVEQ